MRFVLEIGIDYIFHNYEYKGLYNGGTIPEKLPTPEKSLKELEKEYKFLNMNKNTIY